MPAGVTASLPVPSSAPWLLNTTSTKNTSRCRHRRGGVCLSPSVPWNIDISMHSFVLTLRVSQLSSPCPIFDVFFHLHGVCLPWTWRGNEERQTRITKIERTEDQQSEKSGESMETTCLYPTLIAACCLWWWCDTWRQEITSPSLMGAYIHTHTHIPA